MQAHLSAPKWQKLNLKPMTLERLQIWLMAGNLI